MYCFVQGHYFADINPESSGAMCACKLSRSYLLKILFLMYIVWLFLVRAYRLISCVNLLAIIA